MKLNQAQQAAVDQIYGPVLVLAGPGTGKTQLLSARIANILEKTDTNASNILCLTFTDNAAHNMRQRLRTLIGEAAYDVHISTYHGFGSDIITSNPEYFQTVDTQTGEDFRLEKPIDELGRLQIVAKTLDKLDFSSPLRSANYYPKSITSTISELKRAAIEPDQLQKIAKQNLASIKRVSESLGPIADLKTMPKKADKAIELFQPLLDVLGNHDLEKMAKTDLEKSLLQAASDNSTAPITAWKNRWLIRDKQNRFVFGDTTKQLKLIALADVYRQYNHQLRSDGLYDFDDMILFAIKALQTHDDLRYQLQEQYQFILLDEFQDTNSAQFQIVKQLTDAVDKPNVFAVGDDDQAIFAFQGAEVGNMLEFTKTYPDLLLVKLADNYRSHADILHLAGGISNQIESRLGDQLGAGPKKLEATVEQVKAEVKRHSFDSASSEAAWIAQQIRQSIDNGVDPEEIAIIAPKHSYLENIVPLLLAQNIPVAYEKREDVWKSPTVQGISLIIKFCRAYQDNDQAQMTSLLPKILSLDFFELPVLSIWRLNWSTAGQTNKEWINRALEDPKLGPITEVLLAIAQKSEILPLEYCLDLIIGVSPVETSNGSQLMPIKDYLTKQKPLTMHQTITSLSIIREAIRNQQSTQDELLGIDDYIRLEAAYASAEMPLVNNHPVASSQRNVQLMTTFKAKGLEFEHVYLLHVHEDVWGAKAKGNTNKLSLPQNLAHIRFGGSSQDELLRLFYVAITRAKTHLHLTSHRQKDSGKANEPVKFLKETSDDQNEISPLMPKSGQKVTKIEFTPPQIESNMQVYWLSRHLNLNPKLRTILKNKLDSYQLSPTHLGTITDNEYGGWETFLLTTILRFPQAPSEDGEYGNAIHATLEYWQNNPQTDISQVLEHYKIRLSRSYITPDRRAEYLKRGQNCLQLFIQSRQNFIQQDAKVEVNFKNEGVMIDQAWLSGKIDRLEIDSKNKTVRIVDFKTGRPFTKWGSDPKLKKYRQQLVFYMLLIQKSKSYSGYRVEDARLEFVEPDDDGKIVPPLIITPSQKDLDKLQELIKTTWSKIQSLSFLPDYDSDSNN